MPVDQLLPRRADDPGGAEGTGPRPKLAIDILKLTQLSGAPFEMLTRFLRMIQVQRQDFNGRVLTIRQDDKRAIAAMLDIPVDQVALPPRSARPGVPTQLIRLRAELVHWR